jgi:hypothetical protein
MISSTYTRTRQRPPGSTSRIGSVSAVCADERDGHRDVLSVVRPRRALENHAPIDVGRLLSVVADSEPELLHDDAGHEPGQDPSARLRPAAASAFQPAPHRSVRRDRPVVERDGTPSHDTHRDLRAVHRSRDRVSGALAFAPTREGSRRRVIRLAVRSVPPPVPSHAGVTSVDSGVPPYSPGMQVFPCRPGAFVARTTTRIGFGSYCSGSRM